MALTQVQSGILADSTQTYGMKNRIINGAMQVNQRGGTVTAAGLANAYGVDRFAVRTSTGSAEVSTQQSTNAPAGFYNSMLCTVTTADASLSGSELTLINQKIEGVNTTDLAWGTADAQPITISFRVRSSLAGTYGVGVQNNDSNRSYTSSYTINVANTWEYKTVTIPGDTTGTWNAGSTLTGIYVWFGLAAAASFSNTANTWGAADYRGTTGQVNWTATVGNTFYLTGVQLEKGSTATAFDNRSYGTELALCQRYYERWVNDRDGGGSQNIFILYGIGGNNAVSCTLSWAVTKRTAPTVTVSNNTNTNITSLGVNSTTSNVTFQPSVTSAGTAQMSISAGSTWLTASSEL